MQSDTEKLRIIKMQLNELKSMLPTMDTPACQQIVSDVKVLLDKISNHVKSKME